MFLRLFLISLGFTSAFALAPILPIPMIFIILGFIFSFFVSSKNASIPFKNILPKSLIAFLFVSVISFSIQVNQIGFQKIGLNHTISFAAIIIYYSFTLFTMFKTKIKLKQILKAITTGLIIVSLFTIFEFVSKNFFNFPIDSFIPRPVDSQKFDALYFIGGKGFYRSRGFASESGHNALYLLAFLPFMLLYYEKYVKRKILPILLVFLALLTTFSAAATAEALVAFSVIIVWRFFSTFSLEKKYSIVGVLTTITILILLFCVVVFTQLPEKTAIWFDGIFNKIDVENSASYGHRIDRWKNSLNLLQSNYILGSGPGISSIILNTGSTNLYLETFIETGLLGLALFLTFIFSFLKKIFTLNNSIKFKALFSYLICFIHYFIIADYWYPWFWVILAVITYISSASEDFIEVD